MSVLNRSLRIAAALTIVAVAACDDGSATSAAPAATKTAAAAQPVKAPAGTDWTKTISETPQGGLLIGNPDAPVKVVEFASYTCPHCADFSDVGVSALMRDYVPTGRVSFEFRSFIRNSADIAVSLLALCQPPAASLKLSDAFFKAQKDWMQGFMTVSAADQAKLTALPQDKQIAAYAEIGNLDDFVRLRGVPRAKFDQCLADQAAVQQLSTAVNEAIQTYNIQGTPTFLINNEVQENTADWATLKPKLDAAL